MNFLALSFLYGPTLTWVQTTGNSALTLSVDDFILFFFFDDFLHVDVSCNHHTNQHQLTEYFQHPKFPLTIPLLHSLSSGNRDAKFQHHWLVLPLLLVHVNKMIQVCHAVTSQYSFFFLIAVEPWKWQPTPVFLPREFHGQRSLTGCSPWGRKELTRPCD